MAIHNAPPTMICHHICPPVRLSAVEKAMEPPASKISHTARASIVSRMTGPANASYLRIISMP
jgi:hypothetical protein